MWQLNKILVSVFIILVEIIVPMSLSGQPCSDFKDLFAFHNSLHSIINNPGRPVRGNCVIQCPNDTTVNNDTGNCSASIDVPNPGLSGDCVMGTLTWTMTGAITDNGTGY
ncbi:MAG: hypothetical protein KAG99_09540, partial [Bacteroidales bacterium]|nr:hypothetical protein [Bacteroidales bacterium]